MMNSRSKTMMSTNSEVTTKLTMLSQTEKLKSSSPKKDLMWQSIKLQLFKTSPSNQLNK